MKIGRCSYQFACYRDGGMITDGVLLRLAKDRFWMAQADGDLFSWYKAHAVGLNVEILDPDVWVSQVQGPRSLEVLKAILDDSYPEPFRCFDLAQVRIARQPVVISRTGFTNELGWEFYMMPEIDTSAVGDRILSGGERFGTMIITATPVFRARRIEAGLLNAGSDFDETTTPFEAGLGHMIEFEKGDFIGKAALKKADRRRITWGMRVDRGVAQLGRVLTRDGSINGRVCSSSWSSFQKCGVAIVCMDGKTQRAEICDLPMYDARREIPRGKRVDIPEISNGEKA